MSQKLNFLILLSFSIILRKCVLTVEEPSLELTNSILKSLKTANKQFDLGDKTKFVFLLGMNNAGISTVAHVLATNNSRLESIKNKDSGLYEIRQIDPKNTETFLPEMLVNEGTDIAYIKFPALQEYKNSVKDDIIETFLLRKLFRIAREVKLVFVVDYLFLQKDFFNSTIEDFEIFLKYVTKTINVGRYHFGSALVANKVYTSGFNRNGTVQVITDKDVIEAIVKHLNENIIPELRKKSFRYGASRSEMKMFNEAYRFVFFLISKWLGEYTKLAILREPDRSGALIDNPIIQAEKQQIDRMINENIEYVPIKSTDFSFTISPESQYHIYNFCVATRNRLLQDVEQLELEIRTNVEAKNFNNTLDIESGFNNVKKYQILKKLSKIQNNDPREFLNKTFESIAQLNINVSYDIVTKVRESLEFYEFFNELPEQEIEVLSGVERCGRYFTSENAIYGFSQSFSSLILYLEADMTLEADNRHIEVMQCVLSGVTIIFFLIGIYLYKNLYRIHEKKKFEQKLVMLGINDLKKTVPGGINPQLALNEQAQHLDFAESYEITRKRIRLGKAVGTGNFGVVHVARAKRILPNEAESIVAVKMLTETFGREDVRSLILEMKILMHLGEHRNKNIVSLLGVVTKDALMVIVEYCPFGNLSNFLISNRKYFVNQIVNNRIDSSILKSKNANGYAIKVTEEKKLKSNVNVIGRMFKTTDLLNWSYQIASGMHYLTSRNILHNDLAARNVLLCEDYAVKISDFGLARRMNEQQIYEKTGEEGLPMKWLPVEAIKKLKFTVYSDVWSYGVVLWELFSLGEEPYSLVNDGDVDTYVQNLIDGDRLKKPEYATDEIYDIMCSCWHETPELRPNFDRLASKWKYDCKYVKVKRSETAVVIENSADNSNPSNSIELGEISTQM